MSQIYQIPDEYFFRLHHVRPRFKSNMEEVLFYVANCITDLDKLSEKEFKEQLNIKLRNFSNNQTKTQKTIDNWRTEIPALFGFIQEDNNILCAGTIAKRLANNQYLDELFNYFLYSFQYPAGHVKDFNVKNQIQAGIKFKPCSFILQLFLEGNQLSNNDFSITAEELLFCAHFDLRVTTGKRTANEVAQIILNNKQNKVSYTYDYKQLKNKKTGKLPSKGDIRRYTSDILDYMVLANLLTTKGTGHYYYLNSNNQNLINYHINSTCWFNGYDKFYGKSDISNQEIKSLEKNWFDYVNQFENIVEFAPSLNETEKEDIGALVQEYYSKIKGQAVPNKIFGDYGETLILAHEYLRTQNHSNRQHLINKIPTLLGVGYDLQSIEIEKHKRYIEVKSTRSKKAINSNRFKLTPNEWDSAETLGNRYFIYYLVINDNGKNIFIIQNPVQKFYDNLIKVDSNFMVEFSPQAGEWQTLLEVSCSE